MRAYHIVMGLSPLPGSVLLAFLLGAHPLTARQGIPRPVRIAGQTPRLQPRRPFPQHVSYAPGTIRPDHRSQAQQDRDVRRLYEAWKMRFLKPAGQEPDGHPRFRVDTGGNATVSEGQGYGMLLAAVMAGYDPDARKVFDGLWEFALDHPSTIDPRLMDWFVKGDESADNQGDDSAFDGDCDMAYALLLAQEQWGGNGRFSYRREARRVLSGLRDSVVGPQSRLPMLGDWVAPGGSTYNQWTPRSSDFMLGHFAAFERATGDPVWGQVAAACRNVVSQIQADFTPATGLLPDFLVSQNGDSLPLKPAPQHFLEDKWDGKYNYNACRDPWRLGTCALLSGDAEVLAQVRLLARWIQTRTGGNPLAVRAGYYLNGKRLPGAGFFSTVFAAPFGVAAMTDPALQDFLNGLYDSVKDSNEGYYGDSLSLLSLLVMSGNWWQP